MRRAQHASALVRAKLDLAGSVCGKHFVQPEIQIFIAKLVYERGQVNSASIVDACFIRNRGKRSNVDFTSRERLDIQAKQMLDRVESETGAAAVKCFVTSTRLEREVTATRTRISTARSKSAARPRFKLFDRHSS